MEISILLVDDDRLLVEKLEKTMQWEKIGISMVFTAFNIRQAQKFLKEFSIQILLCDIDMPLGSGLELLEWVREQKLEVECIFLSSYASFSYAQKAMKLATREYILKPASNRELEVALAEIVQDLGNRELGTMLSKKESKEEVWRNFWCTSLGRDGVQGQMPQDGAYQAVDPVMLAMVKVFRDDGVVYHNEIFQVGSMVKNILLEILGQNSRNLEAVIPIDQDKWGIVLCMAENAEDLLSKLSEMKESLNKALSLKFRLYIAKARPVKEVEISFNRIKTMEELIPALGNGIMEEHVLQEAVFGQLPEYKSPYWEIWGKRMEKPEDIRGTGEEICRYLQNLAEENSLTVENLEHFIQEMEQFIYDMLGKRGTPFLQLFDGREYERRKKQSYYGADYAVSFLTWIFEILSGNSLYEDDEDAVERIKKYIETHLDGDLSRNILAGEVYLSEDYVSKLFKNATGMSFPNYIAMKRMEKAREYLADSGLSVSEVAQSVGYSNFSYFSKTFRDFTGMTPGEYRNRGDKNA